MLVIKSPGFTSVPDSQYTMCAVTTGATVSRTVSAVRYGSPLTVISIGYVPGVESIWGVSSVIESGTQSSVRNARASGAGAPASTVTPSSRTSRIFRSDSTAVLLPETSSSRMVTGYSPGVPNGGVSA